MQGIAFLAVAVPPVASSLNSFCMTGHAGDTCSPNLANIDASITRQSDLMASYKHIEL